MVQLVSPSSLLAFFKLLSIYQHFFQLKMNQPEEWLEQIGWFSHSQKVIFFFHMASLRRKEIFAAEHRGVWYGARGNCSPGLAGCSCTKANLLSCSLRRRFMVHGQKSDAVMLAQLILIRYSSQAAAPRPQI